MTLDAEENLLIRLEKTKSVWKYFRVLINTNIFETKNEYPLLNLIIGTDTKLIFFNKINISRLFIWITNYLYG